MYRILDFFSSTAFLLLASADGFCPRTGSLFSHRADTRNVIGYRFCGRVIRERRQPDRYIRTRLSESIRENRDKITRAKSRLREAVRSEDHELVERLKAYILHLRKRDPQFATQDAMEDALAKGLFSTAAKLKLKLTDINQNPFRQGLLSEIDQDDATGNSSFSGDVAEDMSWGFDQSFMENDGAGTGLDDDEDYDDI